MWRRHLVWLVVGVIVVVSIIHLLPDGTNSFRTIGQALANPFAAWGVGDQSGRKGVLLFLTVVPSGAWLEVGGDKMGGRPGVGPVLVDQHRPDLICTASGRITGREAVATPPETDTSSNSSQPAQSLAGSWFGLLAATGMILAQYLLEKLGLVHQNPT